MQVIARDHERVSLGIAELDPAERAPRLCVGPEGRQREFYLDWERAIDDGGHLRKCVLCGAEPLYRSRTLPRLTGIVGGLAVGIIAIGLAGHDVPTSVFVALGAVAVLDLAFLFLGRSQLSCYRCRTTYRGMPIARYHRAWGAATQRRIDASGQPSAGSS